MDFVVASQCVATDPGLALECLLSEGQVLERRVAALAGLFVSSGARCDATRIRELITTHHGTGSSGVLLGALADTLVAFAELDRDRGPW
ncbi:MAG: hypothetical protein WBF75_13305 [Pseudonocardiaceae bacterium]